MPTTNKEREIRIAQRRVEGFAQKFGEAHRNLYSGTECWHRD
ncbi:hypothetical protein [Nostoc sp. KVJ20]|nr:hypothetical protein [Nostoc sp. KVJ20]